MCVLVGAGGVGAQVKPVWQAEVNRLFEEAQRYHLGIERPADIKKAYQLYLDVIQMAPEHVDAYYNLAALCFDQKRYDLAENYYRKVLKVQPTDGDALNNLGTVYELQGKPQFARRLYQKAMEVDSSVAMAYYNYARLLSVDKKNKEAAVMLKKALALEPENALFVKQHAKLEGELGKLSNSTVGVVAGGFMVILAAYAVLSRKRKV